MTESIERIHSGSFAVLRRFAQPRPESERCELCSLRLGPKHRHLFQKAQRRLVCACDACALRFYGVSDGHFKFIPKDSRILADFRLTDEEWESLAVPINLAFIFQNSRTKNATAMYPSPAGLTESLLPVESWSRLLDRNHALQSLHSDVEALLVNRVNQARDYFIAPIDKCYELAGLLRQHWRGLSGGTEVWEQIERFFSELRECSESLGTEVAEVVHA